MPRLWTMQNVTRLTLAHNKITEIPPAMANLENMEILNLFNNALQVRVRDILFVKQSKYFRYRKMHQM